MYVCTSVCICVYVGSVFMYVWRWAVGVGVGSVTGIHMALLTLHPKQ